MCEQPPGFEKLDDHMIRCNFKPFKCMFGDSLIKNLAVQPQYLQCSSSISAMVYV